MRLYGPKSLATVLKSVLLCLVVLGAGAFIRILYRIVVSDHMNLYFFQTLILLTFFLIGSFALGHILYRFLRITTTLVKSDPFVQDNVKSLKWIAIDCFVVSFCYIINFFVNPLNSGVEIIVVDGKGIHTDVEYLIFLFAGCFILILHKVFEQAVIYKEENDLTV